MNFTLNFEAGLGFWWSGSQRPYSYTMWLQTLKTLISSSKVCKNAYMSLEMRFNYYCCHKIGFVSNNKWEPIRITLTPPTLTYPNLNSLKFQVHYKLGIEDLSWTRQFQIDASQFSCSIYHSHTNFFCLDNISRKLFPH